MKRFLLSAVVIGLWISSLMGAQTGLRDISMDEVQAAFRQPLSPHPRLLMTDTQLDEVQIRLKSDPALQTLQRPADPPALP